MTRQELQEKAVQRLHKNHRLLCQWATGTGKSGVVLKFLKDNPVDCLILVPEQNNIENWEEEFHKFSVPLDNVTIACYASFHKYSGTKWGLLVFDEAPHIDTERRKAICDSVTGEYVLALGAVIDDDEIFTLESKYGHFDKSYVSLSQAISWNILPSPEIIVIHLLLDTKDRDYWYKGNAYSAFEYYHILNKNVSQAVEQFNLSASVWNKQKMLRAGNERKRFLGKIKEDAVRMICSKLIREHKRFLCFCSSIKQAESLGKHFAFTSKTPASMRLLDRFNNHEIDSLYVVGKLIEGQNLVDIECGVITQLGGTSRITVQELGRIMRSKNPVIYIPVFDDTKDDSFLYTVTSNIPDTYIKHYKL